MMRKFLVNIATKLGIYKWCVKIDTNIQEKKIARAFHKYGLEALKRADEAFSSQNAHLVLYFGTLLGAIREKGFIAHDYDLDVCVPIEERPENIDALMKQYGFVHTRQRWIPSLNRIIHDQYCYKGCNLDIDYLYSDRTDGNVYTYIDRRHETKDWREANATDGFPVDVWPTPESEFIRSDFMGLNVYIPEKAHDWMRAIYGDSYMTPIKSWEAKDYKTALEHTTLRAYRREL